MRYNCKVFYNYSKKIIYFILIRNFNIYNYTFLFIITTYNIIGCICLFSKASSNVGIVYFESNTSDLGLVIGLSCLNGTK